VKLVIAVTQVTDLEPLLRDLTELGVAATQIEGDGTVGRSGLAALMIGVGDEGVEDVVQVVRDRARGRLRLAEPVRPVGERAGFWLPSPYEQLTGGASVFVLPVRRFERIGYA
jgi:uncharacterized protein YaaQ